MKQLQHCWWCLVRFPTTANRLFLAALILLALAPVKGYPDSGGGHAAEAHQHEHCNHQHPKAHEVIHGVQLEPLHVIRKRSIDQPLRILLVYDESVYRLDSDKFSLINVCTIAPLATDHGLNIFCCCRFRIPFFRMPSASGNRHLWCAKRRRL
uniref:Leishmanolysin-like peptidase n=1 Tax=Culex pipiens TaxID=7175 RepID=A0A8D8GJR0_CULPI